MKNISESTTGLQQVKDFLIAAAGSVLSPEKKSELLQLLEKLRTDKSASLYYLSFSKVVRSFGRGPLSYDHLPVSPAQKNWVPPASVEKVIRTLILLELACEEESVFMNILEKLFNSADVGELVTLYSALPLLPFPDKLIARGMEGARSNMGEVFESVANNNPFPAAHFAEEAFNQMVLKCLFIGKPLYKIVGLDGRLNVRLADMARDYAHERWAAHRDLSPELWRLVAPFLSEKDRKDISHLAESSNELEQMAAALVCAKSDIGRAKEIFAANSHRMKVESGELNWYILGQHYWKEK